MSDITAPVLEERGELALVLAGATMGLRPTYEALSAIEATLDRGLVDLARDALSAKMKLAEAAQIATECIRAWGRENDDKGAAGAGADRVARLILDSPGGLHDALKILSGMLSLAVTGGYPAEGELKPSTTTTRTTPKAHVDG